MIAFIYTVCAVLVNFIIGMAFLSPVSLSDPFSLLSWVIQFSLVNYGISSIIFSLMSLHIKKYEYKREMNLKEIFFTTLSNLHNLALISFIGFILAYTVLFSPVYFISIASLTIAGYQGFDAINESFKQLFWRKKYFTYTIPYVLAGILIIAIFTFSLGYILELEILNSSLLISSAVALQWLFHSIAMKRTVEEYIDWGLKVCVYCNSRVPIEAYYCSNCGNRLRG